MKIIGIKNVKFTGKDGVLVTGFEVYYTEPIANNGNGFSSGKFFMTKKRRESLETDFEVNDEIELFYNRFGKVASINVK